MTDIVGSNASAVTAQSQSLFSASIDLEWHNSPEGRGVLAHLMDQSTGLRRNYGKCIVILALQFIGLSYVFIGFITSAIFIL